MYLCIYGVFEAGNLFQTIEMKVVYIHLPLSFAKTRFHGKSGVKIVCNNICVCRSVPVESGCHDQ